MQCSEVRREVAGIRRTYAAGGASARYLAAAVRGSIRREIKSPQPPLLDTHGDSPLDRSESNPSQ